MNKHPNIDIAIKKQKKRNKYNARKVYIDGFKFDSKRESEYYLIYRDMLRKGEIQDLVLHPTFQVSTGKMKICKVILDFQFYDNKLQITRFIDVKGFATAISKLKRRLVEAHCDINVEWVK